jgi:DNA-binding NtrC family response regulator
VVAATHRDLMEEIDAGRFRLDLHERLAGARLVTNEARRPPARRGTEIARAAASR